MRTLTTATVTAMGVSWYNSTIFTSSWTLRLFGKAALSVLPCYLVPIMGQDPTLVVGEYTHPQSTSGLISSNTRGTPFAW